MIPARCAASTLALMPPTGSTRPRSVHSPVIAVSERTRRPESSEVSAVNIVTPAEGPSFGHRARRHVDVQVLRLERVRCRRRARRRGCARTRAPPCADSFITSPS